MKQKILLLDFDGVLHSYKSGWKGARIIPDPPVPGAIEWLRHFLEKHCDCPESVCCMAPPGEWQVCIYSARSRQWGGRKAMKRWLVKCGLAPEFLEVIKFPLTKPPAFITVDDRALCFDGVFETLTERLFNFKPWYKEKS